MTAETFSGAPRDNNVSSMHEYDGGISIETYSAGGGRDDVSMVDNEQLKCTATLSYYIALESAVSLTNFPALLLPSFYEKKFKFFLVSMF